MMSGLPLTYQGVFDGFEAELDVHGNRYSPGKDSARIPIHYGDGIDKSLGHGDVRDIHGPDMIGPRDLEVA